MPTLNDILDGSVTTLLSLSGPGFDLSKYATRGLTATLEPIQQSAQIARDINFGLLDMSSPDSRKYKVTVGCTDQESPGFAAMSTDADGIWPGTLVTVILMPQLGSADPLTLSCMVTEPWQESRDEYGAASAWAITLEEV